MPLGSPLRGMVLDRVRPVVESGNATAKGARAVRRETSPERRRGAHSTPH